MNWEAGRPTCSVTERLAWRCPAWTCDASSLPVRFGFVHLWEGRRTAQSPVNAASIGSAASLMNGPGCAAKGLASLPAAHGDFQEREGWLHSLLEFHCNVRDRAQDGWTCTHRSPMVAPCGQVLCVALAAAACSVLAFLHEVGLGRLWMPDTGRSDSGDSRPCCLLILPGNGHKVKVNSYLLARAPLATQVHQPVHAG